KSWTVVVGELLKQFRNNENDNNLNIEKSAFNYSIQELNTLRDLVKKGQILYAKFSPIESTSFINSAKLVGDNPYIIEQTINNDFDLYSSQLEQIKNLLDVNREEYKNLRKVELEKQTKSIANTIEKILVKEKELESLLATAKEKYNKYRQNELAEQIENFNQIEKEIEIVFNENKNNPDLADEDKI